MFSVVGILCYFRLSLYLPQWNLLYFGISLLGCIIWIQIFNNIQYMSYLLRAPCSFHGAVRLTGGSLGLSPRAWGLKGNLLQQVVAPAGRQKERGGKERAWCVGGEGTMLDCAVEMAVSIKYHFQFPCFMISGLLSTNNSRPPTLSGGRLITPVSSYQKTFTWK